MSLSITGLGVSVVSTIVATGTVAFDAGSTSDSLIIQALPQPSGTAVNMGTVTVAGPFSVSAIVNAGTTYVVKAVASDAIVNTVTNTATIAA